jgi:hypothetical protein
MIRHLPVFEETDDAILVISSQWVSKADIAEMVELDEPSVKALVNGREQVGKIYAVLIYEPTAQKLGWKR